MKGNRVHQDSAGIDRSAEAADGIHLLFVDDEINVLNALERVFMDTGMRVSTAADAFQALEVLKKNYIAVIVSDNLMPGMTGIEFFRRAKDISPESVRIMVTAHADVRSAIDAINKGEVYRFITKPWDDEALKKIVCDAVQKYRIVKSMKTADEATLLSLAQTIELKDPYTRGHCDRVARYSLLTADALGLDGAAKREIKHGSWLHDCGKIGVPETVLNSPGPLDEKEKELMRNHPAWGAEVARQARLSERVINIILHHHERYDGLGYPSGLKGEEIPFEARIVTIADAFDAMTSDRPYRKAHKREGALDIIRQETGLSFDPGIAGIFCGAVFREIAPQVQEGK